MLEKSGMGLVGVAGAAHFLVGNHYKVEKNVQVARYCSMKSDVLISNKFNKLMFYLRTIEK